MEFTKEQLQELKGDVEISLSKVRGLADLPHIYLSINKDGTLRKNSSYTYEDVDEAKERKVFLEGLLTKLNKIKPTDD